MKCEGDGSCLTECECVHLKKTNNCSCYSKNHSHLKSETKRFCITENCKYRCILKDCKTFNYCQESFPERYYTKKLLSDEQCNSCGIFKVKFPNEVDNCYLCFEDKYLIETYCNHRFCLECLIQINSDKDKLDNPCPFCNQNIEFNLII